jgi:hypothetical protein
VDNQRFGCYKPFACVITMRFSAAASLLLTGWFSFVESAKNRPSSLREILQSYPAKREEFWQRNKDQITDRFLAQIQKMVDANPRELQTSTPSVEPTCTADGGVNFDDDYFQVLYNGDFKTNCTCSEGTRAI